MLSYMTDAELTKLLSSYKPSDEAVRIVRNSTIILLVGISGAGKNTLKRELLRDDRFYDFISHTTRAPRSNQGVIEQHGVDYYFIDRDEAIRMLQAGEYIEAKKVHSNIYGTAIEGLSLSAESGKVAINDVDVQGVEEYKAISPTVHAVFVLPPSFEAWNQRRLARYSNGIIDPEDNAVRLASAKKELAYALSSNVFDFIVNDDVAVAADEVRALLDTQPGQKVDSEAKSIAQSMYDQLSSTH
jgi:guanylate kinase